LIDFVVTEFFGAVAAEYAVPVRAMKTAINPR
jgi:hypothetical protein